MQSESSGNISGLSLDIEALGQPQTWVVHHRGLEYTGEVIIADAVDPALGQPLEKGLDFRVVFFTVPRRISSDRILDARIAMAVPHRAPTQLRETVGREIRAIREAGVRYITARDSDALALRRSIEEREASLRGELTRRYKVSYSVGRIYTHEGFVIRAEDVFVEESLESWADHLASAVLMLAHPSLSVDHDSFPYTLTSSNIPALYRGLFHDDSDDVELARAFGPGLGLARQESPEVFDASDCVVLDIIQKQLESQGGEMAAQGLLMELARVHGFPRPLATLYLLAFVRQARAEVELEPGHGVEGLQAQPFAGDRITWDMVSGVSFTDSLADSLGVLRLQPTLAWDAILPYANLLVQGLEPGDDAAHVAEQERRLLDVLTIMATETANISEALSALEMSLGPVPHGAMETLGKLLSLTAVSDYQEFYSVAQESFRGPTGLDESLNLYRRLGQLAALAEVIAQVRTYLGYMSFRRSYQELLFERDSLQARIELESLIANPSLWGSIEEGFQRLRVRYVNVYVSHHARYQQEALELTHRLERFAVQIEALARFNEMPELGEPVGADVPELFKGVTDSFRTCPVEGGRLTLEAVPYCQTCLLPLDEDISRHDVEMLFGAVERAMREYNRRLGSYGVRQILAHPSREQLDKFINLVQVADPSALANVLDDEVVEFLRQFMRGS